MNPEASAVISRELSAGERLMWAGQPRCGIRFRSSDIVVVPFSLMWGGVAFYSWVMVLLHARWFAALGVVPFVLMGGYIIAGRFCVDSKVRERTFYGVTDHRLFMVSDLFRQQVWTLDIRFLGNISLRERPDRSGSIVFGPSAWLGPRIWVGPGRLEQPAFLMIDNVREVYDIIRRLQAERRG
jgi:hypothetical protein